MIAATAQQPSRHREEKPDTPAVFIETYGCQMNEYDSGVVRSLLHDDGFVSSRDPEAADVILLNTCAVREKAHEKIYNRLRALEHHRKRRPGLVIGILGCMAQNLGDDLFAEGLHVDFISGPDNYRNLGEVIRSIREGSKKQLRITQLSRSETYEEIEPCVTHGPLAFVTIMRGCNNFCSFCVVPYTRGRERSRSPGTIIREIRNLTEKQGTKEVTLLGQNVNSYLHNDEKGGSTDFTELCRRILQETELERLRFTSPHPHDFPMELLELMASERRFCSQIHLPLQSGSTSVLSRMKRDYTAEEFLSLATRMQAMIPDLSLTTDVIVGFCGETESEFEDTLQMMEAVRFDLAYMFHYSEREHTLAQKEMADDVPQETKLSRLQRLIELQTGIARQKNEGLHSRVFEVLVEGPSKRSKQQLMGRAHNGKVVIFDPELDSKELTAAIGKTFSVEITGSTSATLQGRVVK